MMPVRSRTLKAVVIAAALLAGAIAPAAFGGEPGWKPLAPAPEARQEVSYVALGGALYLAAGNDRDQDRYDPSLDRWTRVAPLPPAFASLDHVSGDAVDGRIVYAGGLEQWEYPFPVTGEVAIYDPLTNGFSEGSDMPSPRAAGGVAAWHGKLIYAGGLGPEGSVARVDAYDPLTDEWTRLEDMPRPRDHFQAAVVGDRLYAVGGRRTVESEGHIEIEDTAAVDVLDLTTAKWSADTTSLPTPRGGLGVAAVGECIYAIGGERVTGAPDEVTGIVESYDTRDGLWHELPALGVPRHGIQAAVAGKTIYIAGGGTKSFEYAPTAAHEALDVSATEPCTAVEPVADPGSAPREPASPLPPARRHGEPRITHLAVRPWRVRLDAKLHGRAEAKIVIRLSTDGVVSLSLPGRFHFDRRLRAGRNVLPLPVRPHGHPLPEGRYRLVAVPRSPGGGRPVRARFRVVD
jgi:N-acetylneuraminic acid mutarotase